MKILTKTLFCCSAIIATSSGASALTVPAEPGDFMKDIHGFDFFLHGRLRAEGADLDARAENGSVVSLRNRFGIKTSKAISGFKFLTEGEHTLILNNTRDYTAFPGPGQRSVIADPDSFDLNRLQLSYSAYNTTVTLGRQYLEHGDQRFIGSVKWRQNDQTFDAVNLVNTSIKDLTLQYAYATQVNRIFGNNARVSAQERLHGDIHLFRAEYSGFSGGKLSGFAYLLDFDNAAGASTNTYGLEWNGKAELGTQNVNYLLTAAIQNDAGANPASYEEYYLRAQADTTFGKLKAGLGMERFTSNGANSFIIPLGTNHKFNGYADAFLNTPVAGLRDYYAWVGTKCPLGVNHKIGFHHYSTDQGNNYLGYEIDYVAKKKLTDYTNVLFKAAHLEGHGAQQSVQRASMELNYSF